MQIHVEEEEVNIHSKPKSKVKVERAKPNSFSVHARWNDAGTELTFEWRWPDGKPCWNRASKEDKSVRTDYDGQLQEEDVETLLATFGLQRYANAPTFDELISLSPSAIMSIRRKREEDEHLDYLHVVSTRMGDHIPAVMAL